MKFKKFLVFAIVLILCASVCAFGACQPKDDKAPATVMNVSLNPEVEFVLDADGNVLTVNALNEEGNLIIGAQLFADIEGKSAQEAVQLFVQVSKETGYLVSGKVNAGENQIEISLSGDGSSADKLFADIKSAVDNYLSQENIQASLAKAQAITNEQLKKLVEECSPYLEEAQLKAMDYSQLLQQIVESRKETANMLSQEIKNAYYEAKSFAMEQAKLEAVKGHLDTIQQFALDAVNKLYVSANDTLEQVRYDNLISENSAYQKALADFREKKVAYLNFRNEVSQMEESAVTAIVMAQLDALSSALNLAETALLSAGETANAAIDAAKTSLNTAYVAITETIKKVDVNAIADEIAQKQTDAMDTFFTNFEKEFASAQQAAQKDWADMEAKLKQGYQAE